MHAERADHQSQQLVWHNRFTERTFKNRQLSAGVPLPLVGTTMIEHDRNGQMTCSQFTQETDPCTRRSGDWLRPVPIGQHQVERLLVRGNARKCCFGAGSLHHLDLELGEGGGLETVVCGTIIDPEYTLLVWCVDQCQRVLFGLG